MKAKIIAFSGPRGSGKSTSAELAKQILGDKSEIIALADPLKKACSDILGVPKDYLYDPKLKEKELPNLVVLSDEDIVELFKFFQVVDWDFNKHVRPHICRVLVTARQVMQYVGTEVLQATDKTLFCKKLTKNRDDNKVTLVNDLRFLHEYEYFQNSFGSSFLPVFVKSRLVKSDCHSSEKEFEFFKKYCYFLDNTVDLNTLRENIISFLDKHYE